MEVVSPVPIPSPYLPRRIICPVTKNTILRHKVSEVDERKMYSKYTTEFDLETEEYIASGAFGVVVQCKNIIDEQTYAIKKVSMGARGAADVFGKYAELEREFIILAKFDHPSVVRYHTTWIESTFVGKTKEESSSDGSTGGDITSVGTTGGDITSVGSTGWDITSVGTTGGDITSVGTTGGDITSVGTTGGDITSVSTTGGDITSVGATRGNITSIGKTGEGDIDRTKPCLYIQQQICNGTLKEKLEEKLSMNECGRIFKEVVHGLKHIHSRNVMHGDLSTGNVFFYQGQVKIGDFGLSRIIGEPDDKIVLTAGLPSYVAPDEVVNAKADVYSLAIMLVEIIYSGKTSHEVSDVIQGLKKEEPEFPPDWPDGVLKEWITKMLKFNPEERPSSAQIFEALQVITNAIENFAFLN